MALFSYERVTANLAVIMYIVNQTHIDIGPIYEAYWTLLLSALCGTVGVYFHLLLPFEFSFTNLVISVYFIILTDRKTTHNQIRLFLLFMLTSVCFGASLNTSVNYFLKVDQSFIFDFFFFVTLLFASEMSFRFYFRSTNFEFIQVPIVISFWLALSYICSTCPAKITEGFFYLLLIFLTFPYWNFLVNYLHDTNVTRRVKFYIQVHCMLCVYFVFDYPVLNYLAINPLVFLTIENLKWYYEEMVAVTDNPHNLHLPVTMSIRFFTRYIPRSMHIFQFEGVALSSHSVVDQTTTYLFELYATVLNTSLLVYRNIEDHVFVVLGWLNVLMVVFTSLLILIPSLYVVAGTYFMTYVSDVIRKIL